MKAASYGTFSHNFCFILKNIRLVSNFFKCGVVHNFLTKQWWKAHKGGARYHWKRGARGDCLVILPYYSSLSLQSLLLAKRMWLKWNYIWNFSMRASNSADKLLYFQEGRNLYKLSTCSAKVSLIAAEQGQ